jgi:REP element-mobilizing transposase RayT
MDQDARTRKVAVQRGVVAPATYGRGRAVRLSPEIYASDVPIHLTICAEAGPPFADDLFARMVCECIERCAATLRQRLLAYCLMPDRLHVVISAGDSRTPVAEFLRRFKSFTTHEYQKREPAARLWQYSARDRVSRAGESVATMVEYVVNNPVRHGLVRCWSDWAYSKVAIEL